MWVFVAFLVSCALLMVMSWMVAIRSRPFAEAAGERERAASSSRTTSTRARNSRCARWRWPIRSSRLLRAKRIWLALLLVAIALGFFVNMAFVIVSRTALVTMPIMLAVFALLHLKWRTSVMIFVRCWSSWRGLAWQTSPQLRTTLDTFSGTISSTRRKTFRHRSDCGSNFGGNRCGFFAEAPVIGHGTGSTRGLFERAATGDTYSATSEVIGNPHNQTLNVAVQWGIVGVIVLYAMWLVHLLLVSRRGARRLDRIAGRRTEIFTSLFNSHIFDFHEGWMYVLGVGVAGGMMLAARQHNARAEPAGSS